MGRRSKEGGQFRRPSTPGAVTRWLCVSNVPQEQAPALQALLATWGDAELAPGPPGQRLLFAGLPTPAAAAAAATALRGACPAGLGGAGPLGVPFAERCREQPAAAAEAAADGSGGEAPLVAARDAAACGIPGLTLLPDFASPEEEAALLAASDGAAHWQLLAKRRVLHYGFRFDYETRGVGQPEHELPAAARAVAGRIQALPGVLPLDQLTVNEYPCGVGISPHVETHSAFSGAIASLSLGGPAVMVFRRQGHPSHALSLPPRSLLVLTGEARLAWAHYVPHRKSDLVAPLPGSGGGSGGGSSAEGEAVPRAERRVSFTFRQVRRQPCRCAFPEHCDSQLAPLEPTRMALKRLAMEQQQQQRGEQQQAEQQQQQQGEQQQQQQRSAGGGAAQPPPAAAAAGGGSERAAAALEAAYVHRVYDAIAPHFASTRFAVWPKVRAFLESLPPSALLADVGCGNGKYWGVRPAGFVLASDRSEGLARVASRRLQPRPAGEALRADVAVADGLALPYRPGTCDGALCIAVLHHISSPSRRLALLAELLRVLRPGGRALVTVWATQQENMRKVRSWTPVGSGLEGGAAGGAAGDEQQEAAAAAGGAAGLSGEAEAEAAVPSGDYFVPWHLPLHRVEAAAAAAAAGAAAGSEQQAAASAPAAASSGSKQAAAAGGAAGAAPAAAAAAGAVPQVDSAKGTLVYRRYYHLFEAGELEGLVARLPGARLAASFYDRDNWCCVLEKRCQD